MRHTALAAALLVIGNMAYGNTLPVKAFPMENYDMAKPADSSKTRVRINLASTSNVPDSVVLGDVALCSTSACYRPNTPATAAISDTSKGTALQIADGMVPYGTYTHLVFSDRTGSKVLRGQVRLAVPLIIEAPYRGGDVLVLASKQVVSGQASYAPTGAVGALMDPGSQSVFYNPKFSTSVQLKLGAELSIPSDALGAPQIFSVAVRDVGGNYPAVDVYPYIALKKHGSLRRAQLSSAPAANAELEAMAAPPYDPNAPKPTARKSVNDGKPAVESFSQTGAFKSSALTPPDTVPMMDKPPNPGSGGQTCLQKLSNATYMAQLRDLMAQTGAVTISACTGIAPYVHISMINTHDPRIKLSMPYRWAGEGVGLYRMTDWMLGANVMINGYKWKGDRGMQLGGLGRPEGFVNSNGNQLGQNLLQGGTSNDPAAPGDGTKFVVKYHTSQTPTFDEWSGAGASTSLHVLSTSTSIVKKGNCTTDSEHDRWTALGGYEGVTVVMSSTSTGKTTAATLCPIFKAFGIQNALRLDGGGSAAMIVSGIHLNPLEGANRLLYGDIRWIPYPVRFGH